MVMEEYDLSLKRFHNWNKLINDVETSQVECRVEFKINTLEKNYHIGSR